MFKIENTKFYFRYGNKDVIYYVKGKKFEGSVRTVKAIRLEFFSEDRIDEKTVTVSCSHLDIFNKKQGRKEALTLLLAEFSQEYRTKVWKKYLELHGV